MHFQATTLLSVMCGFWAVVAITSLVSWLQDRSAKDLPIWAGSFGARAVGVALFALVDVAPDAIALGVGYWLLILSCALMREAIRAFDGQRTEYFFVALPLLLWTVACLTPGFLAWNDAREGLASLLIGGCYFVAAWELWRTRFKGSAVRIFGIVLLILLGLLYLARTQFTEVLSIQRAPEASQNANLFGLFLLAVYLMLSALVIFIYAIHLKRAQMNSVMKGLIDPSGALKRSSFLMESGRVVEHAAREDHPVSLIVVDLPPETDENGIFEFCRTVAGYIRSTDVFGRLSEREIACLMPHVSHFELDVAARRMAQYAAKGGGRPAVGLSSSLQVGHDLDALLSAAKAAADAARALGETMPVVYHPALEQDRPDLHPRYDDHDAASLSDAGEADAGGLPVSREAAATPVSAAPVAAVPATTVLAATALASVPPTSAAVSPAAAPVAAAPAAARRGGDWQVWGEKVRRVWSGGPRATGQQVEGSQVKGSQAEATQAEEGWRTDRPVAEPPAGGGQASVDKHRRQAADELDEIMQAFLSAAPPAPVVPPVPEQVEAPAPESPSASAPPADIVPETAVSPDLSPDDDTREVAGAGEGDAGEAGITVADDDFFVRWPREPAGNVAAFPPRGSESDAAVAEAVAEAFGTVEPPADEDVFCNGPSEPVPQVLLSEPAPVSPPESRPPPYRLRPTSDAGTVRRIVRGSGEHSD